VSFFYEIRSTTDTVLKRDGGFATQDAAKTAGREDAKRMKNTRQNKSVIGRIMVGHAEKPTRTILCLIRTHRSPGFCDVNCDVTPSCYPLQTPPTRPYRSQPENLKWAASRLSPCNLRSLHLIGS
jgi:hypothetical protein